MSNPLYMQMNPQAHNPMDGLLREFRQFRQMFQGDPREQVQALLNSGRVSQSQYNQAVQMAQQLEKIMR